MATSPPAPLGSNEERKAPADGGLDAQLDRAVPAENAAGFLLAGNGQHPGRVFPLSRNTTVIGRSEKADLRVAQPAVSSEHARIINGSQGFAIEDLGSVNGTFVNDERVTTTCKLRKGDRLSLGNVEFTFLLEKTADVTVTLMAPASRRMIPGGARPLGLRVESDDEEQPLTFADVVHHATRGYRVLRPHFRLTAVLLGCGLALGVGSAAAFPPPKTAVCEVRLHQGKRANPVDGDTRPQDQDPLQFFVDPERSFVLPTLVASTLTKLEGKAPDEGHTDEVQTGLRLEAIGERLYRGSYKEPAFRHSGPPLIAFLTAHLDNYIKTDLDKALRALDDEAKFLNDKLGKSQADLTRINKALAEFKEANADGLPEGSEQAHSSRYYFDTRKSELNAQIARLAGELAVDEAQLKEGNPLAQSKFQSSQVYRGSLQDLKRRLSEAYARGLADGHPEIQQTKNEMVRLEKVIEQEMNAETSKVDRGADPAFVGLHTKVGVERAQLNAAKVELQGVERSLEKVIHAVTTMPGIAAKLDDLQRSYDAEKRLHDQLSEQGQKANLQLEVERLAAQSRFEIVSAPVIVKPSVTSTLGKRAGIGLGVALALAVLIGLIREIRRVTGRYLINAHRPLGNS
jgi:hypothetical protein